MESTITKPLPKNLAEILVSKTPVAYIILDKNFRIHFINDFFIQMRNFDKEKTLGELCYNLSNGGKRCAVCAVAKTISSGKFEYVARKDILPNGELRFMDDFAVPLFKDENGDFEYILEIMINRTAEMMAKEEQYKQFRQIIYNLGTMLDAKDTYTAQHSKNVRIISTIIAKAMQLPLEDIEQLEISASLHDIGKVMIDYHIINKKGKLTDEEFGIIKKHSLYSGEILKNLSGFDKIRDAVESHHERFDGKGYPRGLKGDDIPLWARILAIADTYDAMTSTRSYRKALSHETAMNELHRNSGTQFDPAIIDVAEEIQEYIAKKTNVPATHFEHLTTRKINARKHSYQEKTANLQSLFSEERFIQEILKNTPAAYTVLDRDFHIIYTSDYFKEMFHIEDPLPEHAKCFETSGFHGNCDDCPVSEVLKTNQQKLTKIKRVIGGKTKYLDCYNIPFTDEGNSDYVIQVMLDRTEEKEALDQTSADYFNIIANLSQLLYKTDTESYVKSQYMRHICEKLCKAMNLSEKECQQIDLAASLCDIGMISLSDIKEEQSNIVKKHPELAYKMLKGLTGLSNVQNIIRYHHEAFDGSGYPDGISGNVIPLGSRILYLTHSYCEWMKEDHDFAINNIVKYTGTRFDPSIVKVFLELFKAGVTV